MTDDLISRQAVFDRYYAEWEAQVIYDGMEDRDWLKKCIDEAPSIEAPTAQPETGWISVKDRLPEDERPVLTFMGYDEPQRIGFQQIQTYFCFDPNPHWQYSGLLREGQSITHWMPLPKPPKENDNGN